MSTLLEERFECEALHDDCDKECKRTKVEKENHLSDYETFKADLRTVGGNFDTDSLIVNDDSEGEIVIFACAAEQSFSGCMHFEDAGEALIEESLSDCLHVKGNGDIKFCHSTTLDNNFESVSGDSYSEFLKFNKNSENEFADNEALCNKLEVNGTSHNNYFETYASDCNAETKFVDFSVLDINMKAEYLETNNEAECDLVNEISTSNSDSLKSRKRKRNPESCKQNVRKQQSQKGLTNSKDVEKAPKSMRPTCAPTCFYSCSRRIPTERRQRIHSEFCKLTNDEKEIFYGKFIKRIKVKRRRSNTTINEGKEPKKKHSFEYYFNVNNRLTQVCRTYFLNTLVVSTGAIANFRAKHFKKDTIQSLSKLSTRGEKKLFGRSSAEDQHKYVKLFGNK